MNYLENSELHRLYGELDKLFAELKAAKEYRHEYFPNGNSKAEEVQLIEEDITITQSAIDDALAVMESFRDEDEVEEERSRLCYSQGISRFV